MSEIDRIMDRLRRALATAQNRVAAIEKIITTIEKARADLPSDLFESTLSTYAPRLDDAFPEQREAGSRQPRRVRGDLAPYDIAKIARETLLSEGKPLKRDNWFANY